MCGVLYKHCTLFERFRPQHCTYTSKICLRCAAFIKHKILPSSVITENFQAAVSTRKQENKYETGFYVTAHKYSHLLM
jgi:hypothetical protein